MKESGGQCSKARRWERNQRVYKKIPNAGIPVMGHLGLTPNLSKFGTYTVQRKEEEEADKLIEDAQIIRD
jgi:3-methyl-2-oxobutanoate hydroxymethyltransferase